LLNYSILPSECLNPMEGNIWPMSSLCLLRPCICKKKIAMLHFSENYIQIEVRNYWVYKAYMYKRDYAKFRADSFVKNCLDVTCSLRHEKLSSKCMYLKVNNIPLVLVHLTISIIITKFKIFRCLWLAPIPWLILHNQLALTIFERCKQCTMDLMVQNNDTMYTNDQLI